MWSNSNIYVRKKKSDQGKGCFLTYELSLIASFFIWASKSYFLETYMNLLAYLNDIENIDFSEIFVGDETPSPMHVEGMEWFVKYEMYMQIPVYEMWFRIKFLLVYFST